VTSKEQATGTLGPCKAGGSEFKSASPTPTYACNGEAGSGGGGGGYVTSEGKLAAGKTETGTWSSVTSSSFNKAAESSEYASISFAVPLEEPIIQGRAAFVTTTEQATANTGHHKATECPGTVENPEAAEGFLCVYQGLTVTEEGSFHEYRVAQIQRPDASGGLNEAGTSGAIISIYYEGEAVGHEMRGSWAVTAE
jgi:hypothetical protein